MQPALLPGAVGTAEWSAPVSAAPTPRRVGINRTHYRPRHAGHAQLPEQRRQQSSVAARTSSSMLRSCRPSSSRMAATANATVLALQAGVAVEDRAVAKPCRCLVDKLRFRAKLLVDAALNLVRHGLPHSRSRPRGSRRPTSMRATATDGNRCRYSTVTPWPENSSGSVREPGAAAEIRGSAPEMLISSRRGPKGSQTGCRGCQGERTRLASASGPAGMHPRRKEISTSTWWCRAGVRALTPVWARRAADGSSSTSRTALTIWNRQP